jgi:CRISPR-associated endonuclease/helicase Cas3
MESLKTKFFAHSLPDKPLEEWQPLEDHLKNVAEMAGLFANQFGAKLWAVLLGENHDLGKGTCAWQAYLRRANNLIDEFAKYYEGHPTHAFTGAQWLHKHSKEAGKLLAYCIAGHHGGLPNWDGSSDAALRKRLQQQYSEVAIAHSVPKCPTQLPISIDQNRFGFQLQFFTRMLFSCLVDADFLDTEASLDKEKS